MASWINIVTCDLYYLQGSQGRAYLFNSVVNVGCGPAEERVLLTGLHAVADIFCDCCKTTLGMSSNNLIISYYESLIEFFLYIIGSQSYILLSRNSVSSKVHPNPSFNTLHLSKEELNFSNFVSKCYFLF